MSYELDDGVALVSISSSPLHLLAHQVRAGLIAALDQAKSDPRVQAVILKVSERMFSARADVDQVEEPIQEPSYSQLNERCETSPKPVIAAIDGPALGVGLELALSCHARVVSRDSRVGLPEVMVGLIPRAGGTQRLPRLIGPTAALELIVSGKSVDSANALKLGLVDRIIDGDLLDGAKAYARELAEGAEFPVPLCYREEKLHEARSSLAEFESLADKLTRRSRDLAAPRACVEAVRAGLHMSFDEGLEREQSIFAGLNSGFQSKAQRHLYLAERDAAKIMGLAGDPAPRDVRTAAIIGAGTMGAGIAMAFANAGIPVTLLDINQHSVEHGLHAIRRNYDISVGRGSLTAETRDRRMALLTGTTRFEELAGADIIIEAVFEEMNVKLDVFGRLDKIAKFGAILASNTSFLDIDEIAAATSRPADVVGMHFFSPANVMRLLEIVRGQSTAPDVLATAVVLAEHLGKAPVVVGVCHGFVGNRMLAARTAENESLLLEGAEPEVIDKAFTDFGFPMGPFAMFDLSGLDISWRLRKSAGETAAIADALCEMGRFGQKSGKGFYLYEAGSRTPLPDPQVRSIIETKASEFGITRRHISPGEIVERTIYPMINEAARILEEGIATRASDIDVVWVSGYGFPVGKGGPMFWADHEGLPKIVKRLNYWRDRTGNAVFEPAPLLLSLAQSGGSFAELPPAGLPL